MFEYQYNCFVNKFQQLKYSLHVILNNSFSFKKLFLKYCLILHNTNAIAFIFKSTFSKYLIKEEDKKLSLKLKNKIKHGDSVMRG